MAQVIAKTYSVKGPLFLTVILPIINDSLLLASYSSNGFSDMGHSIGLGDKV